MDFSALNDIPKLISPRWDAIIGYGAGALCTVQCIKSTWRGSKEILNAFCGEDSYRKRIQDAATDNLNVLSNTKNMVVGSDSFSKRFKHFQNGLEDLFIGGFTGLFAYLLFFEVFSQTNSQPPKQPDPSGQFEQDFRANFQNSKKQVDPYQEKNCFWAIFSHPNVHSQLTDCHQKGFLSEDYDFSSIQNEATKQEVSSCLRTHELFLKARSLFIDDPTFVEAIDKYTREHPGELLIEGPQVQEQKGISVSQAQEDENRAVTVFNNQNWNQLDPIVQNYFDLLKKRIDGVVRQSEEYLTRHQNRLKYYRENQMQVSWAPISIDLATACDLNFFNKLPFAGKDLTSRMCGAYKKLQDDLTAAEVRFTSTKADLSLDFAEMSCDDRRESYLKGLTESNTQLNWRQFRFYDQSRQEKERNIQRALSPNT